MLPGFRFLFAAIVLTISLLIFGLGAAALLRAAHQEFASLPSRPAPPEPVFASQREATLPSLAMMRVDAPNADEETSDRPAPDTAAAAVVPESPPIVATAQPEPKEPDNAAALPATLPPEARNSPEVRPPETPASNETPRLAEAPSETELSAAETPPATEATATAEVPSSTDAKLTTIEPVTPPPANLATPDDAGQSSAVPPASAAVETKTAMLGGSAVEIEPQTSPIKARRKSAARAEKKRQRAERANKRRKMAQHARAVRRASQAANPFGTMQPFGGFPGAQSRTQ